MNQVEWKAIKHFSSREAWGDPSKISSTLVHELDAFRELVGIPFIITCGTQGVHVGDSYHYLGQAVDLVIPSASKETLFDIALTAMRFTRFGGIGVYPDWQYNGSSCGGLHLDVRSEPYRAQWLAVNIDGKQVYQQLNKANIQKAGL